MQNSGIFGGVSKDNFAFGMSQNLPGKIDDVSLSVNKQIKLLEDKLVEGYDQL